MLPYKAYTPVVVVAYSENGKQRIHAFATGAENLLYENHYNGARLTLIDHRSPQGYNISFVDDAISYPPGPHELGTRNRIDIFCICYDGGTGWSIFRIYN
jgi:hypothetical protein